MAKKKSPLARLSNMSLDKFNKYFDFFNDAFIQREPIILRIKYAILLKEHILLKGRPGVAKSDLAMGILKNIIGARVFKQQFTSFMDESYLFGPQILEELKKGNIMHNTKNSIVDCHFAFLDEFFNANEETIIAGNSLLNEREFIRNSQYEKSDIMTAIMTTNRSRENEDKLKPIYDRIIFNAVVGNVEGNRNKLYVLAKDRLEVPDEMKLTLEEIQEVQELVSNEIDKMTLDNTVIEQFDNFLKKFEQQASIYMSDRKALKYFKAFKMLIFLRDGDIVQALKDLHDVVPTLGTEEEDAFGKAIYSPIREVETYISSIQLSQEVEEDITAIKEKIEELKSKALTKKNSEDLDIVISYIQQTKASAKSIPSAGVSQELVTICNNLAFEITQVKAEYEQKFPPKRKAAIPKEEAIEERTKDADSELDWINELRQKSI